MYQEPTALDKLKMGAFMGACVGLTMGFCFGTFTVLRYGPGPKGYIRTVGQYMAQSGASFAFFLSIGSVIRGEPKRIELNNNRQFIFKKTTETTKN